MRWARLNMGLYSPLEHQEGTTVEMSRPRQLNGAIPPHYTSNHEFPLQVQRKVIAPNHKLDLLVPVPPDHLRRRPCLLNPRIELQSLLV